MEPPLFSKTCTNMAQKDICNQLQKAIHSNQDEYNKDLLTTVLYFFKSMESPSDVANDFKAMKLCPNNGDEKAHFKCGHRMDDSHIRFFISGPSFEILEEDRQATINQVDLGTIFSEDLEKVTTLELASFLPIVSPEWIQKVSQSMANVEHLHLLFTTLDTDDFKTICNSMPGLKSLCIFSGRRNANSIKSLNGISKLQRLEKFSLTDNEFTQKEDILELFELEHLTSLDLSRSWLPRATHLFHRLRNAQLFVECKKVLQNLLHFDCSGNILTKFTVQTILNTHPTLESIVLLETRITDIETINENIKILNAYKAVPCTNLIKHYLLPFRESKFANIFTKIGCETCFEDAPSEEIRELFMQLVTVFDVLGNNDKYDLDYIYFFFAFWENDQIEQFTISEDRLVIKMMMTILKRWSNKREIDYAKGKREYLPNEGGPYTYDPCRQDEFDEQTKNLIYEFAAPVLNYYIVTSKDYFQQLFRILTKTILNMEDFRREIWLRTCIDILLDLLKSLNDEQLQSLGNTKRLKRKLLEIVYQPGAEQFMGLERLRDILSILCLINKDITFCTKEINGDIVFSLLKFIEIHERLGTHQQMLYDLLHHVELETRGMIDHSLFLNKHAIKTTCLSILKKGSEDQIRMSKLLISFYFYHDNKNTYPTDENDKAELHGELINFLNHYQNDDQSDGYALFKTMAANRVSRKLADLANWVLQCENKPVTEPNTAKRRRVDDN